MYDNKHLLSASTELLQERVGVEAPRRAGQEYERRPTRYFGGRREHVQVEVIHGMPGPPVEAEPVVLVGESLGLFPLAHLEGDAPPVWKSNFIDPNKPNSLVDFHKERRMSSSSDTSTFLKPSGSCGRRRFGMTNPASGA